MELDRVEWSATSVWYCE